MPTYISLLKLTEQGTKNIEGLSQGFEQSAQRLEGLGGKLLDYYLVMGEYDFVVLWEVPSEEIAASFLLRMGAAGNVMTTTLRAFTRERFADMAKGVCE